jgi:transposase-like protein
MAGKRKSYSASFKAQLALAALRGDCTANELAAQHGVHPTLISNWKKALLDGASSLFVEGGRPAKGPEQPDAAELFEQIGRLKMELEWLKKTRPANPAGG